MPDIGEASHSRATRPTRFLKLIKRLVTDVSEATVLGVSRQLLIEHLQAVVSAECRVNQSLNDREDAFIALVHVLSIKSELACAYLDELVLEYHAQM